MYTIGSVPGVSNYNVVVKGTGDTGTDNSNLDAAVTQLNSWGKGTLWIDGTVYVTTTKDFTAPIHMRGVDGDARIIVANTTASFSAFTWNNSFNPFSLTAYTISTSKERSEYVSSSGTGWTPTTGEWVVVWSANTLTDVDPHSSGGAAKPMEIHQVQEVDTSALRAYFADPIIDILSSSGRLAILDLQDEVVVQDLVFEHNGSQNDYCNSLLFKKINGVKVRNIRMDRAGGGAIWATFCANTDISNIFYEGTEANDNVYGVVAGVVNQFRFRDSVVYGTRHGFTTTAGVSSGTTRYGTPLNCVIDNVTMHAASKIDASNTKTTRVGLDTHAEGWGIVFQNCNVHMQGDTSNIGIQTRSRNTVFKNCKIMGSYSTDTSNGSKGLRIYGKGATVKDCFFEGLWKGVETNYVWTSGLTNNAVIDGCTFRKMSQQGVLFNDGSGHTVNNCLFSNCGAVTSRSIVDFPDNKNSHYVTNCTFIKNDARTAINQYNHAVSDIKVLGNSFIGFSNPTSSGPLGFRYGEWTCTVTAATDTINATGHTFIANDPIHFVSTGTVPSGLVSGTTYYAVTIASNTFKVAATSGGSAIDIADGSGTITVKFGALNQNFETAYAYSNHYDSVSYTGRKSGQDSLGSISGATTINFGTGTYDNKTAVLTGNITLTATGTFAGEHHLLVSQDAVGGRTITWSNVNWNGTDPVPASGALATSLFQLYHDSAGGWYGLGYYNS